MEEGKDVLNYVVDGVEVKLTVSIMRKQIITDPDNQCSDAEVLFYMKKLKDMKLNPYVGDCHIVKPRVGYKGEPPGPAQFIVSRSKKRRIAKACPDCKGWSVGVVMWDSEKNEIVRTNGITIPGLKLIGAWFEGQVDGWEHPVRYERDLAPYVKKKKGGEPQYAWRAENQAPMVMKVVESQGLSYCWVDSVLGTASAIEEEMDSADKAGDHAPGVSESFRDSTSASPCNEGGGGFERFPSAPGGREGKPLSSEADYSEATRGKAKPDSHALQFSEAGELLGEEPGFSAEPDSHASRPVDRLDEHVPPVTKEPETVGGEILEPQAQAGPTVEETASPFEVELEKSETEKPEFEQPVVEKAEAEKTEAEQASSARPEFGSPESWGGEEPAWDTFEPVDTSEFDRLRTTGLKAFGDTPENRRRLCVSDASITKAFFDKWKRLIGEWPYNDVPPINDILDHQRYNAVMAIAGTHLNTDDIFKELGIDKDNIKEVLANYAKIISRLTR